METPIDGVEVVVKAKAKAVAKAKELKLPDPIYITYEDYPIEDLITYGGIDCIVTSELLSRLWPKVHATPAYVVFTKDEKGKFIKETKKLMSIEESYERFTSASHEFIMDLEVNGIKYDVELNKVFKVQLETEIAELERVIWATLKIPPFNLDSGQQLGHFLYNILGLKTERKTKTGELSTDGDTIKELAKSYPDAKGWLAPLAKRGDLSSIYRTFVSTYIEDFVKRDGRVHASYSLHGTGSFRIAGDSPNLTQLPRPKHGYNLRRLFKVEDGMLFMAFDFSSAEVKILGALCKDPALLKAIEMGQDFHALSASKMFGVEYDEFIKVIGDDTHPLYREYKEKRQHSKALTFGILYGSSPNGIALNLGISKAQAEELISLYFDAFPMIKVYVDCTHAMAKENGYVVTPFGQRKMEYGAQKIFEGTAVFNGCLRNSQNVRVQSTSSTFGMQCFAALNAKIKPLGAKSICTVYDSIELEVPIGVAAEVLELAFKCLDDDPVDMFDWLDLSVGVDAEIGLNWGDAVHISRGTTQKEIEDMFK